MFDAMFPSHWSRIRKLYWLNKLKNNVATYEVVVGNPVSFTAKAAPLRQLSVAFSPVQDLHGYDSPWPAGGGKNKCPDKKYQANSQSVYIGQDNETDFPFSLAATTYTLSFTLAQQTAIDVYIREEHDAGGTRIYSGNVVNAVVAVSPSVAGKYRLAIYRSAGISANDISNVQLELGSSATSYAPYSNICPILGWDSLNVEQRGKNLWDETWELGTIDAQGQPQPSTTVIRAVNYCSIVGGSTVFGYIGSDGTITINWYDADKNFISAKSVGNATATAPANAAFFRIRMSSGYGTTYLNNISINYPATDHDYHAYNPSSRSISITLGSTVYSGTVDVVTGVVTVTHRLVDLGSVNWIAAASTKFFYTTAFSNLTTNLIKATGNDEVADVYCSIAQKTTRNTINDLIAVTECLCAVGGGAAGRNVQLSIVGYTPADGYTDQTFKTAMAGVQFCYELETHIPISLTPQEVESLAGDNTMWSNANQPITVEYRSN